jgi:hypothetical protein
MQQFHRILNRLIWQESRLILNVPCGRARRGAIYAKDGSLAGPCEPFDPVQAITKSAELLRDLERSLATRPCRGRL